MKKSIDHSNKKINRLRLLQLMIENFNIEELRSLCFDINVDYDDVAGETKSLKIREIIASCERRGLVTNLIEICQSAREHISWAEVFQGKTSSINSRELVDLARSIGQEQLRQALKGGEFEQKYVDPIYVNRAEAEDKFNRFVRQKEKKLFVVTGKAGKGKSNLLCHLAGKSVRPTVTIARIPVLLSGAKLDLNDTPLPEQVARYFFPYNLGGYFGDDSTGFYELCDSFRTENVNLLLFIDAVNEIVGQNAFSNFNKQLAFLIQLIKNENYPVLICLSCRSEFWPNLLDSEWARADVFEAAIDAPTVELGDFHPYEIDEVIKKYFKHYLIKGELILDARKRCCEPIILRYFCEAYTKQKTGQKVANKTANQWVDIGTIQNLPRKEVFDRFAWQRRDAILKSAGRALKTTNIQMKYKATTIYLITMANRMFEEKRPYITLDEVQDVAKILGHDDAGLNKMRLVTDPNSIMFHFIDEGIILEKRREGEYEFVFEMYFEYSLGRYIALMRWPKLLNKNKAHSIATIETDFTLLLNKHTELLKQGFTNLFGALQFAILTVETDEQGQYQSNEGLDFSDLFVRLIANMSQASEAGLNWVQQALATIRDTKLADPGIWQQLKQSDDIIKRRKLEDLFGQVLDILDGLTLKSDFVILWDLENTVLRLATANFELTLARIARWAMGSGLQPMFAAQVLTRLGEINPHAVIRQLSLLANNTRYLSDFWLARALVSAALNITKLGTEYNREVDLSLEDYDLLRDIVNKFVDPSVPEAIRSYALAALPFFSQGDNYHLNSIRHQLSDAPMWGWWNLAYGLREWPSVWSRSRLWVYEILDQVVKHESDHICYAAVRALTKGENLDRHNPDVAARIRSQGHGKRWKNTLNPGRFDYKKAHLTGLIYHPDFLVPAYDNHIECRERIQAIISKLEEVGREHINWVNPRMATEEEISWVHHSKSDRRRDGSPWPGYVTDVKESSQFIRDRHTGPITGPLELRPESYDAALLSAGGVLQAVDYVLNGDAKTAWSLGRPPGHLANNVICIFNNVAIGAVYALKEYGLKRILVVDCDAHHGKHTNQVFLADPNVVYFSFHIEGDYAREDGTIEHIGKEEGTGYTFNLPYPPYMPDDGYIRLIDRLLYPIAKRFQPELILLSAGFDGHFDDYFTPTCILSERAYIHLAKKIHQIADELHIKVVGALEGGYSLDATANSIVHMMNIIGEWGIAEEDIGFIPFPSDYNKNIDIEAMKKVDRLIDRCIELIAATKKATLQYMFDPDMLADSISG